MEGMAGLAGFLFGVIVGYGLRALIYIMLWEPDESVYWKSRAKVLEDRLVSVQNIVAEDNDDKGKS